MKVAHIEIKEVDSLPENWTSCKAWPAPGLYFVKSDRWHALVGNDESSGVNVIYGGLPEGSVVDDAMPGGAITETLLLKAIAAASRAETLK